MIIGLSGLNDRGLDLIFREARTHGKWRSDPVPPELFRRVYDLARMGPTSLNSSPARFLFVTSLQGKEKLRPALMPGNLEKTMAAPVTVIVGYDTRFHEHLPQLAPRSPDAQGMFAAAPLLAEETAFRNSSLQGAYLIIAARALGLDCGPMSGFDKHKVNEAFWSDGRVKVNFLCNIGYADGKPAFARNARLTFEQACQFV